MNIQSHAYCLLLHNLDPTTTAVEVADWMWAECGVSLVPEFITLRPAGDLKVTAIAPVSRHAISDFFDRMLQGKKFKGNSVTVRSER
jgi:hypothetical protein